ncbi:hypothetical protein Br6_04780 [Rhodococcus sp. Br-6]|nr:hypothetical protein Br6_04780 [Rhodococcus sp. Br-6]
MDHTENGSAGPTTASPYPGAESLSSAREPVPAVSDQDLDAAFAAYDDAGVDADDDVLFAYSPEVLFDPVTGATRLSVELPISDDTVQPVHIPLEPAEMAALVSGLAEARTVRRRAEAIAAGIDPDTITATAAPSSDNRGLSMQGMRDSIAGKRLVDPAGLAGIRPDDFPPEILGIPRQKFFGVVLVSVVVLSILLAMFL